MKKILLTSLLALGTGMSAQLSGSKTIGTDYPTLSAAFADLNINGIASGGVILNVPAGYSETAPAGGYLLGSTVLNASLSSTNQLIIQKSGSGANPQFTGNTGTSGTVDAIFKFSGVDYMTLDGIDLRENQANTTAVRLNERGFAFYNLTGTDGCNNNTIKNSTITFLKTLNNAAIGIMFIHTNAAGLAIIPTSAAGTHSNNKIYSNTIIKSLSSAINFTGYSGAPAPYTLFDQGNDIGGDTAATGNTLTDIGGTAGGNYINTNYGFFNTFQNNTNVSNNIINFSPDGKGTVGIMVSGVNSTFTANNNTINAVGQTDSNTGTQHIGIYGNSAGLKLTANNNKINVSATSFEGRMPAYGVWSQNTGGIITANDNSISVAGTDAVYGIYANASGATATINNNTIKNIVTNGAFSNASGIYLNLTGITTNISGNKISNVSSNSGLGTAYGLYVGGSSASTTTNIYNNLIGDIKTPSASNSSLSLAGIYLASLGATSNLNVYYNTVNLNGSSSGTNFNSTGIYHTYNATATTASLSLRNNIIVNTSTPKGTGTASAFRRSAATNLENYAITSDNNDFAVGPAGFVYFNGTTKYNFADFKSYVSTRESNSLSIIPQFASTAGTDADYLKLNSYATVNEQIDNKGLNINGFSTDFAGSTRNAQTPDIGAFEFTYTAASALPDCTTVTTPANTSNGITPNPVTISWTSVANATGYKLYLGTTTGGSDIVDGILMTNPSYSTNLDKNKTYYIKVVPTNNIGDATGCSETTFSTTEYTYCPLMYGNVEPISNVTFAGINNSSNSQLNGSTGYQNFTNITGQVYTNLSSALTVAGNTGDERISYYSVFIDWNQNGILNDTGEVYFGDGSLFIENSTGADGQSATGNIAVPATAKLGLTRMRIKKEYSESTPGSTSNFANPCDKVENFGQVEDYTLNVLSDSTLATSELGKTQTSVYPNPFTDILNISDIKGIKSISINDMTGRQVKSLSPSPAINLSALNVGLYIVNLQLEDGSYKSFRVIKK